MFITDEKHHKTQILANLSCDLKSIRIPLPNKICNSVMIYVMGRNKGYPWKSFWKKKGWICDSFRLSNNLSQDITTRSNIREVPYMETVHLKFLTTIILEMKAPILMQHLNKGLFSQLLSRQNVDIFRKTFTEN